MSVLGSADADSTDAHAADAHSTDAHAADAHSTDTEAVSLDVRLVVRRTDADAFGVTDAHAAYTDAFRPADAETVSLDLVVRARCLVRHVSSFSRYATAAFCLQDQGSRRNLPCRASILQVGVRCSGRGRPPSACG